MERKQVCLRGGNEYYTEKYIGLSNLIWNDRKIQVGSLGNGVG